jgi:ABC-type dipeptide/oligopeptide/nickel transport system permease subunit
MIESGQEYITESWWLIFIPGITLIITLLSINEAGRKFSQKINPSIR